jgi:hypothetical protein
LHSGIPIKTAEGLLWVAGSIGPCWSLGEGKTLDPVPRFIPLGMPYNQSVYADISAGMVYLAGIVFIRRAFVTIVIALCRLDDGFHGFTASV